MKQEVLDALSFYGIKKSKVESDLGMPQNSLSGILKGSKEIPKKWVEALRKYVDDLNNPQKDLETPKEAQQEPETEKTVESKQNETVSPILPVFNDCEARRIILNSRPEQPTEFFGNIARIEEKPILQPNQTFDQLLKQFNNLVELAEKPKDIKLKLEQIKESAKNSNLTPRQTDAIVDRCNHLLNNNYNQSKHNLKLS